MGWEDYLREIKNYGTFGDEITLPFMSEIFNVDFQVISTLGPAAWQIITPHNSVAMARLHVVHFAENEATHYAALNPNQEDCEGKYLHHFFTHSVTFFRIRQKSAKEKRAYFVSNPCNSCLMIEIGNLVLNVINLKKLLNFKRIFHGNRKKLE